MIYMKSILFSGVTAGGGSTVAGHDGEGCEESESGVPADSWEAVAEYSDPPTLLTPDDEDLDDEEEDGEEEVVVKPKKKPVRPEETRSKKEHVNVVIIGHVGT